jgi:DNA-binding transcriptional LysR family regulator
MQPVTQSDLNLIAALDVLLEEQSVTAAAVRLHLSVPATSRTLTRIRRAFGDPILVRAGRGLVPTPYALAIKDEVHQVVASSRGLFQAGLVLDPARLERRFTIRASDALITQFAPPLLTRLESQAPGVTLRFTAEGDEDLPPLRDGHVDLDLGVIHDMGPEVRTMALYEDHMVGLAAPGHPLATGTVTLERLAAYPHVVVSRRGRDRGPLDDVLEQAGLSRRVAVVVPTHAAAAFLILSASLTGILAGFAARELAATTSVRSYDIPAPLPPLPISAAWHARYDADPAHRWLRSQLQDIASELADSDRPVRQLPLVCRAYGGCGSGHGSGEIVGATCLG